MRWWILGAVVSLIAVAHAESQPRQPGVNGVPIRVRSGGNELVAMREAPVAYATLDQLVVDIVRPAEPGVAPIRIVRAAPQQLDRKSTRLNSSHLVISYAVFCLKKKKTHHSVSISPSSI